MKTRGHFAALVIIACLLAAPAGADYSVGDTGDWPDSWSPKLEPLRKQSRTYIGPIIAHSHYAIRFNNREEFESAWPELLKAKTPGAPIFLLRGPNFFLGKDVTSGVVVHSPPPGQNKKAATPEAPIAGSTNERERWMYTTYIDLVVDGEMIDLNRIPLPPNTPIVDERFKAVEGK